VDQRRALDAVIFRLRTGCQWNHFPRAYGHDSTIHRSFQNDDGQGAHGDHVGPNPTDRAKNGSKRSILSGGPLSAVVAAANVHDTKLLDATLEHIVIRRPEPTAEDPHHVCPDKAYDDPTGEEALAKRQCIGHMRRIGEETFDKNTERRHPARRWVAERIHAWLSRCRGILVRYEKKAANYLALIQLACASLWYRKRTFRSF